MCLIHLILLMIYLWITCVSTTFYLFSSSFRNFIHIIQETIQLRSYEHEERYLYWIIMMMKEITLIIAYSLLAFFFKFFGFVNNDSSITQMHVRLWFIEASFFPLLFVCCFCIYYVGCMYDIFDEYQTVYIIIIMLKVPLFFWMRYAECQLDAFPNRLEAYIQSAICKVISERKNLEIF
jgi:NADH:ubiquinone oxidoreductase subunit 5 (subunit L)/multisubunit Na+/H+ antiporter MnhA subunit